MLQFFKNRGYPDSVVKTAQERAEATNQQSVPQTTQKEENQRIPFTLSFHPDRIHSDVGLTLETSVFESFTVANLPYRPCG